MENKTSSALPDIRKTTILSAGINKVWEAVATADGIAAWFMPNDFQPVEGYEFHINAGQFGMSPCKVTKVEPPHRVSFQWGKDWIITFELKELNGQTEFTLIHSGWDAAKMTEFGAPHAPVRDNMAQGWEKIVQSLANYVEK